MVPDDDRSATPSTRFARGLRQGIRLVSCSSTFLLDDTIASFSRTPSLAFRAAEEVEARGKPLTRILAWFSRGPSLLKIDLQ